MASAAFGLSLFCTYFFFEDPYRPNTNHFSTTKFIREIGQLYFLAFRERLFALFLLNLLGWYLVIVSISYFLIQKFNLTHAEVAIFNSYSALCFTLGGILGTAWILHRYRARKILFWMQILGSFGLFSLFGAEKIVELWIYLAIPAITEALIYPAYQTMLSDRTNDQSQGKVFGLINATNGACQMLAAWVLSIFPSNLVGTLILFSAGLFLISGALLPLAMRKKGLVKIRLLS